MNQNPEPEIMTTSKPPRGKSIQKVGLLLVAGMVVATAGVITPKVRTTRAGQRDAQRIEDLHRIRDAVQEYLVRRGSLPAPDREPERGGWDTTIDGKFLSELVREGLLDNVIVDPVNDASHHYRYYRYEAGYEGFPSDFFVLGVRKFETDQYGHVKGYFAGESRNWSDEFAYVIGGTAKPLPVDPDVEAILAEQEPDPWVR